MKTSPQLSRRVGQICGTKVLKEIGHKQYDAFIAAVKQARDFSDLDQKWQDLILAAEKELGI